MAGALVLLLVVVVAGAGLAWFTTRASFPQVSGTVTVAGLSAPVEVRRDEWGVPQITADTAEDLFMAQGYVHAQDRFWEMDFRRHVTAGRLSELFGDSQLETDVFIRTMGWRHVAEQELALLSPEAVRYLQAYAAGVNAYLADHSGSSLSLEYAVLGLQNSDYEPEPWTPVDSLSWLKAMAWNLGGNMDQEVYRVRLAAQHLSDDQLADLDPPYPYDRAPVIVTDPSAMTAGSDASALAAAPPIDVHAAADRLAPLADLTARLPALLGMAGGSGVGSNSFVVDGSRTTTGMPILANDTHLGASMPGIWYQVGLHCRALTEACPYDVTGFSFSGFPGVVLGHNNRIAWGFTNLNPDVQDLYLEDVQGDQYRVGTHLLDLDIRIETIDVAGGDSVTIRVRSTEHGPLLSDASDYYRSVGSQAQVRRVRIGEPCRAGRRARVDGPDPGRHRGRALPIGPGSELRRVPERGQELRGPLAEHDLRRPGRAHRLPGSRHGARSGAPATESGPFPAGTPTTRGTEWSNSTPCRGCSIRRTATS